MYLKPDTIEIQNKLAEYCRTGVYSPIKGVDDTRVSHYRRLVFNNINNTLKQAFPITNKWLQESEWLLLVESFFEQHNSQNPKIWQMPKEFMDFVSVYKFCEILKKPTLNDLLKIEWLEIEVYTMPDGIILDHESEGEYLNDHLVLVPEYSLVKMDYPVHKYRAEEAVKYKGDWFVYIFRNQVSGAVVFLDISPLHVFILEKIYEKEQTIFSLLPYISSVFGIHDLNGIKEHIEQFLKDIHNKGAIIGFRPSLRIEE